MNLPFTFLAYILCLYSVTSMSIEHKKDDNDSVTLFTRGLGCFNSEISIENSTKVFNKASEASPEPYSPVEFKFGLENFVQSLRASLYRIIYDVDLLTLTLAMQSFNCKLKEFRLWATKEHPPRREISDLIAFAQYLLFLLVDASEILNYCKSNESPAEYLAYSIIDLNVKTLSLIDSRGNPDFTAPNFGKNIQKYSLYSEILGDQVERYFSLPYDKKSMFNDLILKAGLTLENMKDFVPT